MILNSFSFFCLLFCTPPVYLWTEGVYSLVVESLYKVFPAATECSTQQNNLVDPKIKDGMVVRYSYVDSG